MVLALAMDPVPATMTDGADVPRHRRLRRGGITTGAQTTGTTEGPVLLATIIAAPARTADTVTPSIGMANGSGSPIGKMLARHGLNLWRAPCLGEGPDDKP